MKLSQLQRRHPDYRPDTLRTHRDLFAGGDALHAHIEHYLPRHDLEPGAVYARRCASAHYLGYVAPIVGYFASWLFTAPPAIALDGAAAQDPPEFYAAFAEDCDGLGTDLDQFLRARFVDALVARRAFWAVEMPEAPAGLMRADWLRRGADRATLRAVAPEAIVHWRDDDRGAWEWVLEYARREDLEDLDADAPTIVQTWTQWRADGKHRRWQLSHPKGSAPDGATVVPEVAPPACAVPGIPLVELRLPPELWVLNLLADGALEHFRKSNALSWSIDRTCYAMPFFFLESAKKPPTMGRGYYGILGKDERIEWPAPPAAPFATIQDYNARLRDELHRVVHQMAIAAENNAATLGRSGESKAADQRATETVLAAFGGFVREATEKTLDLVARARGEALRWSVGGMDGYSLPDPQGTAAAALATDALRIPSPTFRRALLTRVALAQLPDADEATRQRIRAEIEAGVTAEDTAPAPPDPAAAAEPAP